MTVEQLIAKLAQMDPRSDVILLAQTGGYKNADDVQTVAEDMGEFVQIEHVLIS